MSPQLMAQYVVRVMHASTCSTQCLCSHGRFCCVLSCRDDAHVVDSGGVITNLSEALQVNMRELDEWGANVRTWIATHIKEDLVRRSLVPFKEYHDALLSALSPPLFLPFHLFLWSTLFSPFCAALQLPRWNANIEELSRPEYSLSADFINRVVPTIVVPSRV